MIGFHVTVLLIALITAISCVLPGIFLVLRGVALMSDAISHAVLLGIVIFFLWFHDLNSPLLLVGAAFAGMATVFLTEFIISTRRLREDAAIGLVFPLFFSCGVILISLFARDVHLDVDMVILGEIAWAPFNRLLLFGYDFGPVALYTGMTTLILNIVFIRICYKELIISTFDHDFAYVINYRPMLFYYLLMFLTSLTCVTSFDIVGSVMVVALMITPPATALLVVRRMDHLIALSIILSIVSTLIGYVLAFWCDISIAGSISTISGVIFLLVFMWLVGKKGLKLIR